MLPALVGQLDSASALLSLWVFPGYRVAEFLIGVTLGWAVREGWRPAWSVGQAAVAVVVAYVGAALILGPVATSVVRQHRAFANLYGDLAVLLPLAGLIVAVAAADLAGRSRLLATPLLVRLGEISFAFYLVHSMVILLMAELGLMRAIARGLPLAAVALTVSLGAAWVLHRGLERPVESRLRARLAAREARRALALVR